MVQIVDVKKSNKKGKKLVAEFDDGKKIHFGSRNSKTFLSHQDEDKRRNYLKRHMANPRENYLIKNNIVSPATLSAKLLWGKTPSLKNNIKLLNKNIRFE